VEAEWYVCGPHYPGYTRSYSIFALIKSELLNPTAARPVIEKEIASSTPKSNEQFEMTKEEEEELAELLSSD
jgi:hypothetical protein